MRSEMVAVPARVSRRRALARLFVVLGAVLATAAILAACGSSSSSSNGSAGASNQTSRQASQRLKFTQCLRQHGVNVPDPGQGGGPPTNVPQSTLQAAASACRKYAGGAFGNISTAQRTQFQNAALKYASCLRQHGINIPDPTFGSGGGPGAAGGFGQALQQAQKSPNFQQANAQCRSALPSQIRNGPGPGGGA